MRQIKERDGDREVKRGRKKSDRDKEKRLRREK
jgi:hypothetical protein